MIVFSFLCVYKVINSSGNTYLILNGFLFYIRSKLSQIITIWLTLFKIHKFSTLVSLYTVDTLRSALGRKEHTV